MQATNKKEKMLCRTDEKKSSLPPHIQKREGLLNLIRFLFHFPLKEIFGLYSNRQMHRKKMGKGHHWREKYLAS